MRQAARKEERRKQAEIRQAEYDKVPFETKIKNAGAKERLKLLRKRAENNKGGATA